MFARKISNRQSKIIEPAGASLHDVQDGFVWLNYNGDMEQARTWLHEIITEPDAASMEALCDELTRPRMFVNANNELILTLRAVYSETANDVDLVSLRVRVTDQSLITMSRVEVPAVNEIVGLLDQNSLDAKTPYEVLWKLCDLMTEQVTDYIAGIDETIGEIEDQWESSHTMDSNLLHTVRLAVSRVRRFISPQLEAFQKLMIKLTDNPEMKKGKRQHKAQWGETVNAIRRDIEALNEMQERVIILRDALHQSSSDAMNRIMYILSIVATFFLPLTFVASLLGMNVNGIPLAENPLAFLSVVLLMMMLALMQWLLFRRWRWLR